MISRIITKRLLFLITTSLFISSCAPNVAISNLSSDKPKNMDKKNETYFYNDSLDVKYSFWGKGGVMWFDITNKTDRPIYINWFRSKCFIGEEGFNYWNDVTTEKSKTKGISGVEAGRNIYDNPVAVGLGVSNTTTVITKPEKITFVAPHSTIRKVVPLYVNKYNHPIQYLKDSVIIFGKNHTNCKFKDYSKENSPLYVRNFMSVSSDENFKNESYIDNFFWVSKLIIAKDYYAPSINAGYEFYNPVFRPRSDAFYIE